MTPSRMRYDTWPADGASWADKSCSRVVLPEPDSPTTAITSPGYSSNEMSRQPICAPYHLVSAFAWRRGWSSVSIMVLLQRLDGANHTDIIHQPRPERAPELSKDARLGGLR